MAKRRPTGSKKSTAKPRRAKARVAAVPSAEPEIEILPAALASETADPDDSASDDPLELDDPDEPVAVVEALSAGDPDAEPLDADADSADSSDSHDSMDTSDGHDASDLLDPDQPDRRRARRPRAGEPGHRAAAKGTGADSREIAKYDPLGIYMREVGRYRLLTREEEHELGVKYVEHGDVEAARALVTANLRLVVKIAHEYRRAHQNLLDLVQEGNVGLMQAVKKYDPYQGVKFSSYAAWWIRAYILKYIMSNFRLVKLGTTQAQRKLFFNLKKEKDKLEAQGFDATPKLIASSLDVREDEVREMDERMGHRDLSLDAPLTSGDGGSDSTRHLDLLRASAGNVDERLADAELTEVVGKKLREFAAQLPEKERFIYENRLVSESPITLQELGDRFGISRERARQIEKRIVDRARAFLRKELGRDFDLVAGNE